MNALLLYFSGTGNTKHIGEVICEEFKKNNSLVDMQAIEDDIKIPMEKYDVLIIGYPIYYMYPPIFVIDYIRDNINKAKEKKKVILFATMADNKKSDFKELEEILRENNYEVVTTKTFQMPNNYTLYKIYKLTDEKLISGILDKSRRDARLLVNNFINGIYSKENMGIFSSRLFKFLANGNTRLNKDKESKFSVDKNCTGCMKCVNKCPKDNIVSINGKINFGNKCVLCTRCINGCPMNAILYKGRKLEQYKFR